MSESVVRTGRCLCGQVTVELAGEPLAASLCHCVNCQKTSGSAFSSLFEDTSWLHPAEQIYCQSAQRWLNGGVGDIRRYPGMAVRPV
jgi:hypothetical protein